MKRFRKLYKELNSIYSILMPRTPRSKVARDESLGIQKVQVVKAPRRRRRGPKLTKLLKDKVTAKLRYVDDIALDASTVVSHNFSCNGIFDPDITGTGHQPLLRDQYALLYGAYRVLSSKITVTLYGGTTTSTVPAVYGLFIDPGDDGTFSYATANAVIEDDRVNKQWSFANSNSDLSSAGRANKALTVHFSNKMMGPQKQDNVILMTTNPATNFQKLFTVWTGTPDGTINPGIVRFIVEIEYVVEFSQPINLAQS